MEMNPISPIVQDVSLLTVPTEAWGFILLEMFFKKCFAQTNSVPGQAPNMPETYVGSRNMSVILALLAIIFRRYLFYIILINTVVELHQMRSLELTRSLVGRLCHLGIEEIWFKVLSMSSGWGCTWQDAWSHALQILFFKIPTKLPTLLSPKRQSTLRHTDISESVLTEQASSWIRFLTFLKEKRGKVFLKNFGVNTQDTMSKSRSLQYKQSLPWKTENTQNSGSRNGYLSTINNEKKKKKT